MVVLNGSELHPVAATGTPDPVEVEEVAAEELAVVAEAGVAAGGLEVEEAAGVVAPTSGTATTPSIMIITVPDRGAGGARTRVVTVVMIVETVAMIVETVVMIVETVVMIVETVAMTVETGVKTVEIGVKTVETGVKTAEMIETVESLAGVREEEDPRIGLAEPTERTPRLLPRYIRV